MENYRTYTPSTTRINSSLVTDRLYYQDAYTTEFSAVVTEVDDARIILDRTLFYPTSGGQQFDTGSLGGTNVVDVIDEDERIVHLLSAPAPFAAGAQVTGRVDWARRFEHMQQHTGQHLLSAVFDDLFGHGTVSVHFGPESATLDLDTDILSADRAVRAEQRANELIFANRTVTVSFEDAATATGLRKPSDRDGELRIVTIEGVDRSACGGTHIRATGEIGPLSIRRVEKYKKFTRVEFRCGWLALKRARADFEALSTMATRMTSAIDELPALVAAQLEKARTDSAALRKAEEELAGYRMRELAAATVAGTDDVRRIVDRTSSIEELRAMARVASTMSRVLFVGATQSPPAIVFAATADSSVDAGASLKAALARHSGRGGGSPRVAQGTVESLASLDAIVAELAGGV